MSFFHRAKALAKVGDVMESLMTVITGVMFWVIRLRLIQLTLLVFAAGAVFAMSNGASVFAHTEGESCHAVLLNDRSFHYYIYRTPGAISYTVPTHYHGHQFHACDGPVMVSITLNTPITGISLNDSTLRGTLSAGTYPTSVTFIFRASTASTHEYPATTNVTFKIGNALSMTAIDDITVTEHVAISKYIKPTVSNGWGATVVSHSVSGGGSGLSGSSGHGTNRHLSGTPVGPGDYTGSYLSIYRLLDYKYRKHAYDSDDGSAIYNDSTKYKNISTSKSFNIFVDGSPAFASDASIDDQVYQEGTQMTAATLPEATGGNGALTYSLSPDVPGLSLELSTRTLSGTPTATGVYTMTYTVSDDDGSTDTLDFAITVNAAAPTAASFGSKSVSNQEYVNGEAITDLVLPEATTGSGTMTYRLNPAVPGLTFTSSTRTLSGTPTETKNYGMIYSASNVAGSDSLSFTIDVAAADTAPSFGGSIVATQTFDKDVNIGSLQLPAATGGNGNRVYSLTPTVPGLSFDASTRLLTGTPTTVATTSMTYKVSDSDSNTVADDEASLTFDIVVSIVDLDITGFAGGVNNQSYVKDEVIPTLQLPLAQGGNTPITYVLTPTVSGLDFDASSRQLTGTPDTSGRNEMTYKASDADTPTADTSSLTFVITVDGLPAFDDSVGNQVYQDGVAITTLTLPEATGGDAPVSYTLTPEVPGLAFDDDTRELTGEPSAGGVYAMTYRATDGDGDVSSLQFDISVNSTPSFSTSIADMAFDVDASVGLITLPAADGGNAPVSYQLVPVPNGLTFYAGTRHLAGIPTGKGVFPVNYIATDDDGETATQSFSIEVADSNTAPGYFSSAVASQVYTVNQQIGIMQLPTAVGGNAPFSYTLEPAIPGLTFHPLTRQVTGTPTAAVEYDMTYEVTDVDGQKASLQFKIHVKNSPPQFSLGSQVGDKLFLVGQEITPLVFPAAVGGNGDLTYSVKPPVPGLILDNVNRRWSGTPTEKVDYTVSLVATDADGDRAMIQFRVLVQAKIEDPSFGSVSSVNWN